MLQLPGIDFDAQLRDNDEGQDAERYSGNNSRADEDHRHKRRHPEGIGLDRTEDEAGIAMQKTGDRDTGGCQYLDRFFILLQGVFSNIPCSQGQDACQIIVDGFQNVPLFFTKSHGGFHKMLAVDKPQLRCHDNPVGHENNAEGGYGRCEMGCHQDVMISQWLL